MTRLVSIIVLAAFVPLGGAIMFLAVPALRPAGAAVDAEVREHVERARRLVMQCGENEERLSGIIDQLQALGVPVDLDQEGLESVLDEHRDVLDTVNERLTGRSRGPAAARLRDLEESYRSAGGANDAPMLQPGGLGSNPGAILRQAREVVGRRRTLLAENRKALSDALTEINSALAVTVGDADGNQDPFANRLKGIILLAQARTLDRDALRTRSASDGARASIVALIRESAGLAVDRQLVERSHVRDRLDALHADARELERRGAERAADVARLEAKTAELQEAIDVAKARAKTARQAMESMRERGANLLYDQGAQEFDVQYSKRSADFRGAVAEAQRLETGTLTGARIDDTGDYLVGRFVPDPPDGQIAEQRGLIDYLHDRETAVVDRDGLADALRNVNENIESLTSLLGQYDQQAAAAAQLLATTRDVAAEQFAAFQQRIDDADSLWTQAEGKARLAVQAFRSAGNAANQRTRDAQSALDTLSPTAKDRSPDQTRSQDGLFGGQISNETAQAKFVLGSIQAGRFQAAAADFELVTRVRQAFDIEDANAEAYAEKRDDARRQAAENLRGAAADYERSHRELANNWTVPAELGAVHYLLSVVEGPTHVRTAIENYQNAVDAGNRGPYAAAIADRLDALRNR